MEAPAWEQMKKEGGMRFDVWQDVYWEVWHSLYHYILFLVFIWLEVEYLLQGPINISDTEEDQSIEHCRENKEKDIMCATKVEILELYPLLGANVLLKYM